MTFASTGCRPLDATAVGNSWTGFIIDSHAQLPVRHNIVTTMRIPPCLAPRNKLRGTTAFRIIMVPYISSSRGISIPVASRRTCTSGNGEPLQDKVVDLCLLLLRTVRSWPEHLTAATRYRFKFLIPRNRNRNEGRAVLFGFQASASRLLFACLSLFSFV